MNISYRWLQQYIDFEHSPEDLGVLLTGCGLEVESIDPFESVKGGLKGLVVGEVLEAGRHPNADRLTVCKVNVGDGDPRQIVCGAPNVAAGQKVIVALPGTLLHPRKGDPFEIKKSKIRGEESHGMICAEDEIGLGESHEGILVLDTNAVPGAALVDYFKIENDYTISIGLTPNRPDAASHLGVARDLRAVLNTAGEKELQLQWPDLSAFTTPATEPLIKVRIEDEACYRYSGLHIENISVAPSPEWLQNRLKAIGLSPINNVVDITNFVLYEYGQPLHAFDASKIAGGEIMVKRLTPGTLFKTLDEIERKLNGSEMMICDTGGGLAIAGVFGGATSGVTGSTTSVFLESAYFDPVSVRKTSKLHGLKTDASFRFERGTDPEMTLPALKRAAMLICEIAGGTITSKVTDVYPKPAVPSCVSYHIPRFEQLTGVKISNETLKKILGWLDIKIESESDQTLQLTIPPYRVDVTREADVTEEILRIVGFDRIPLPAKMQSSLPMPALVPLEKTRRDMASRLTANGFTEIMCNSIYRSSVYESFNVEPARIKNPLSRDLDILRPDMLHPMLDTALYNFNRQRNDLRFFEYGKTYHKTNDGYHEENHLSLLLTGKTNPPHWSQAPDGYTIYFIRSVIENLMVAARVDGKRMKWENTTDDFLSPALSLLSGKKEVARIGMVRKKLLKQFDLSGTLWHADLHLDVVASLIRHGALKISEPPRFPEVLRDLSMVLDRSVQYRSLEELAYETERKLLQNVNLFDVYEGEKIGEGKKSYALSFTLRDDERTLTDKDIERVMSKLMDAFEKKLGAVVRTGSS